MSTAEVERAAHSATVALTEFDRAGVTTVLQTVPALAQTLRELLAAVTTPTPPTVDVREALALIVEDNFETEDEPRRTADAILATFEVRPRGTVTDATRVSVDQRDAVADHVWDQMVGVAKSAVREVMADAFASAGIGVTDEEVPGFEGTRDALDSLSIRGGESS